MIKFQVLMEVHCADHVGIGGTSDPLLQSTQRLNFQRFTKLLDGDFCVPPVVI